MTKYSLLQRKSAGLLLALSMGVWLAPNLFAQISFMARKEFSTVHNPVAVAAADFNGDDILDVAVLSRSSGPNDPRGSFVIMLGDGLGNFTADSSYQTGKNSAELIAVDFNGDGKPDIALTNEGDDNVMIFLNNGQGRFGAPTSVGVGRGPVGLVAIDLDGDQKLDLAVANSQSNSISVLKGNGQGGFSLLRTQNFGTEPRGLAAGNLGRGVNDLIVTNFANTYPASGTVLVLLNNGAGTFTLGSTLSVLIPPSTQSFSPRNVVIADFNNDGKPDIAVTNFYSNNITRFLGRGDGTFTTPGANIGVQGNPAQIIAADYNRDGKMDLFVLNRGSNNISVLDGNGTGGFTTDVNDPTRTLATNLQPRGMAVADFNNDGQLDVVVANFGIDTVSVILGGSTRRFNTAGVFGVGGRPWTVALMDINADGKLDALTVNDSSLSRLFGDGTGKFSNNPPGYVVQPPDRPAYNRDLNVFNGANGGAHALALGDFNRSGITSLAVTTANNNSITRIIRAANQTPTSGFTGNNINGVNSRPVSLAVGDLNGDGFPDLVSANVENNSISYLINDGGATGFKPPKNLANVLINPTAIAAVDMNGDGWSDLIVVSLSSVSGLPALSIYLTQDYNLATGDLTFAPPVTYDLPYDSAPFGIAVADFDGDGRPDVAIVNQRFNNVSIFLNQAGDGTLVGPTDFATGGDGPEAILARDLNGDGIVDLAAVNTFSNSVSILLGVGDGSFGDPFFSTFGTAAGITGIDAGDLNGDGKLDLVLTGYGQNNIYVLLNTTP